MCLTDRFIGFVTLVSYDEPEMIKFLVMRMPAYTQAFERSETTTVVASLNPGIRPYALSLSTGKGE